MTVVMSNLPPIELIVHHSSPQYHDCTRECSAHLLPVPPFLRRSLNVAVEVVCLGYEGRAPPCQRGVGCVNPCNGGDIPNVRGVLSICASNNKSFHKLHSLVIETATGPLRGVRSVEGRPSCVHG